MTKNFTEQEMLEVNEDRPIVAKEMREFRCGTLFKIKPTKAYKDMSNEKLFKTSGTTPVLSNSAYNNGIGGHCGLEATEEGGIITFSDTTTGPKTMFYQPDAFIGYSHVQGMYPYYKENWDKYTLLYFISAMKRESGTFWDFSIKFNRKIVAEITPLLPIQVDNENNPIIDKDCKYHECGYIPDWDFMQKYIKAMEKLVIDDVISERKSYINKVKSVIK